MSLFSKKKGNCRVRFAHLLRKARSYSSKAVALASLLLLGVFLCGIAPSTFTLAEETQNIFEAEASQMGNETETPETGQGTEVPQKTEETETTGTAQKPEETEAPQKMEETEKVRSGQETEVRAVWISFNDYGALGLANKSKKAYRQRWDVILKRCQEYGINTVYFHVRAFDDASWMSRTFPASSYMIKSASRNRTAAKTYSYDPLKIAITECHRFGLKIEAWINPYRISQSTYLDPASSVSTARILRVVDELKDYELDGFHFDDYFYSAGNYYFTPNEGTEYKLSVKGKAWKKSGAPKDDKKRQLVNAMLKAVYQSIHFGGGRAKARFGISPAGNVDYCQSIGADVMTWLKEKGYLDYIVPQIYWTDVYYENGRLTTMYSNRLNQWTDLNQNGSEMIIGLASTYVGSSSSYDRGWSQRSDNLKRMVELLRKKGSRGYALFSASDLFRAAAQKELTELKGIL